MKQLKFYSILVAFSYLPLTSDLGSDEPYSPPGSYRIDHIGDTPFTPPPLPKFTSSTDFPTPNKPFAISEVPHELVVQSSPPSNAAKVNHGISINFNNVSMVEYIRFVSKISNKNFIFNEDDLKFNVTIISEEPTSIENMMAALIQELRIRDLSLLEEGNNIIIHRNPKIRAPSQIVAEGISNLGRPTEIITRVFRLNTLDPSRVAEIIKPLLSENALIEVLRDSNNLIITDLVVTIDKISQLIDSLDAPIGGMTIGQYHVRNSFIEALVELAVRILTPIAQGNPFELVSQPGSNSIYVVSNPFIVDKALAILQQLDSNEGETKILTLEGLKLEETMGDQPIPGVEIPIGPGEFEPGMIGTSPQWIQDLPAGHIERTLFYIHKLKYRLGDEIEIALRKIGDTLAISRASNQDLLDTIESVQWLESSNSLIFAGTPIALDKIRELIDEIDVPLRQVFIEMLILDTSLDDSLNFGVDWGSRFGGGGTAGAEGFFSPGITPNTFIGPLNNASFPDNLVVPNAASLASTPGLFQWGIIGQHVTFGGLRFNTIGALVTAIHRDAKSNIVLNPKIITEDNNPAEIFVGETDQYRTQSIANDQGNTITNNYQLIDLGTLLRVTPLIGNDGLITMDIIQETTESIAGNETEQVNLNDPKGNVLAPLFRKNRTTTRVHVPDGFFVVISGQIRTVKSRSQNRIPCLGGVPLLGVAGKSKVNIDTKRNLMLFIRPVIVDTACELEELTRREQNLYREKCKFKRFWNYEMDEGLDFMNIKSTDRDDQWYYPS